MKKTVQIVAFILLFVLCFSMVSCNNGQTQGNGTSVLPVPTNLSINNSVLSWNFVENAIGYTVKIVNGADADINNSLGEEIPVTETEYSLASLPDGKYTVGVKARGDSTVYLSSPYTSVQYVRTNDTGVQYEDNITGAFGSFDEVNTKNSYLGYGIDIINASSITSKDILMNYPIFDMEKLMNETLLKSNDRNSRFESLEASTIEEFLESMSLSSSITAGSTVSASGNIYGVDFGGSVSYTNGLKSQFTKTSESIYSQYFLEIISENQSYWLILQTPESRYKEILSDEFKSDLYNPQVTPAQLFNKYGTHLLTSVAMGGNICMYYTMFSYSEEDMSKAYAEISSELKQNVEASYGNYSSEVEDKLSYSQAYTYMETAKKYGIQIDKKIISAGGDFYGISSETSLYANFADWQKSLDAQPVVIGIKDSNSLYAIWDLLDLNVDGAAERYEELYTYFMDYGTKSYKELLEFYKISPPIYPEEIDNIKIGEKTDSYKVGQIVQVNAGDVMTITFDVLPENAIDYTKAFSVAEDSKATINKNGELTIDSDAKEGNVITVTITAGEISKEITLIVVDAVVPDLGDEVSKITYNLNNTIKGEVSVANSEWNAVCGKTTTLSNAIVETYPEYYFFEGWYTKASDGVQITDSMGKIIANVAGYTDSEGRWIHNGDVELYAKWVSTNPNYEYIETAEELKNIATNSAGKYIIITDIDMQTTKWEPIASFSGELLGDGHSIFNFYIEQSGKGSAVIGLFSDNQGFISDVVIGKSDDTSFESKYSVKYLINYKESSTKSVVYVGAIAGSNNGTIEGCCLINVCIEATMADTGNGNDAYLGGGGISGANYAKISECKVLDSVIKVKITASEDACDGNHGYLGGITSFNAGGKVSKCESHNNILDLDVRGDGTLFDHANTYGRLGGIAGIQTTGEIVTCPVSGNVLKIYTTETKYTESSEKKDDIVGKNENGSVIR